MKTLYLLGIIYIGLIMQGCASTDSMKSASKPDLLNEQTLTPHKGSSYKDPLKVSFFTPEKKHSLPYHILGKAKVSTFNEGGIKRQEATIKDLMRQLAAAMNGDAVIDLHRDQTSVVATVIAYKQVMA